MKFSIIICTYNAEKKLPKTLDSVFSQTDNDYEVIIIDGASSDSTTEIIKKYEKIFTGKLTWISEKDTGIYNAMNKGVKMANGEYLVVVGAGDWFEKDALENAKKCIDENPQADAVLGKTRIWDNGIEDSRIVQTSVEDLPTLPIQHPALFYKKSLHSRFGLYDETYKISADYAFCLKAFYLGKASIIPFDVVVDNFVMDGASSRNSFEQLMEKVKARKDLGLKTKLTRELKFYIKGLIK